MWTITGWYEEARREAAQNADFCRRWAEHVLTGYERSLPGVARTEVVSRLHNSNVQRLAAVPDLTKYPELRGMRDLVDAQWRGTRDGAGLTDGQWAANCDGLHYYHRNLESLAGGGQGCSYVFFPESDHGPILANNLDSTPEEPFGEPAWIALSEHLIYGGVSCGIYCDEQSPETFPAPIWRLAGRYCRTTDEATEFLTRYKHFWGPGNGILIDRDMNVAMVEKSACRIGVRHSPDGFGFITAMTMHEPSMKAYLADRQAASLKARGLPEECADTAYWRGAGRRHDLMNELLEEARESPTLEGLRRFIQFRDPRRGQVCYNGEILFPGGPPCEHTLRTTIWLLREGRAMWWAKEGDTPSFENRMPDLDYKDVWLWD